MEGVGRCTLAGAGDQLDLPARYNKKRYFDRLEIRHDPENGNGRYIIMSFPFNLSDAMKRPVKDNQTYTWLSTSMHRQDRGDEEDKIIRKNPTWKETN
jgi:hypothetical protein